jgi:hypothetical protein
MIRHLAAVVGLYLDDCWLWKFARSCGRKAAPRWVPRRRWCGGF